MNADSRGSAFTELRQSHGFVARLGGDGICIASKIGIELQGDVVEWSSEFTPQSRNRNCLGIQIATDASIGIALAPNEARPRSSS